MKDINPGTGGSSPTNFTAQGSYLYFAASDGSTGTELWRTDGSAANTALVKDIVAGSGSSSPGSSGAMFSAGSMLYFQGIDQSSLPGPGWELYSSTGNIGSGGLLKDINVSYGGANSAPDNFAYLGSGNTVYFVANDEVVGSELWKSDGTSGSTVLVKDITPGADGTTFSRIVVLNNKMYFTAYSSVSGVELWQSDGTSVGTIVLKDINPGLASSAPLGMAICGSYIYFSADDGTNGRELWRTDGTAGGTELVSDIVSGSGGSNPGNFLYHASLHAVLFYCLYSG
ncbi:MAG: ELWxxDGT repeat protein [Bacteroidota bacterium]